MSKLNSGPNQNHSYGKLCKIKDFLLDHNINKSVDLIAMIAYIEKLKYVSNGDQGGLQATREVYLIDDSWHMVKMITKQEHAYAFGTFEQYQVLLIKNIYPVRKNNTVLLVANLETKLIPIPDSPEAIALTGWYFNPDLSINGFSSFQNVSTDLSNNVLQSSRSSSSISPKSSKVFNQQIQSNESNYNNSTRQEKNTQINTVSKKSETICLKDKVNNQGLRELNLNSGEPPTKRMHIDALPSESSSKDSPNVIPHFSNGQIKDNSCTLTPTKVNVNGSSEILNLSDTVGNDEIYIGCKEEKNEKNLCSNPETKIKEEFQTKNESNESKLESSENDIPKELYTNLMQSPFLIDEWKWTEYFDRKLINFLIKNPGLNLNSISTYDLVLREMSDIFPSNKITSIKLRLRVEELGKTENYFHLLKVCGNKFVKTEDDLNEFIKKINMLRREVLSNAQKNKPSYT